MWNCPESNVGVLRYRVGDHSVQPEEWAGSERQECRHWGSDMMLGKDSGTGLGEDLISMATHEFF